MKKEKVDLEELALRLKGLAHFLGSSAKSGRKYGAKIQPFVFAQLTRAQEDESDSGKVHRLASRYGRLVEKMEYTAAERLANDFLIKLVSYDCSGGGF